MAIRAVCFDIGGVVARISYHWAEMLERAGYSVPDYISPADPVTAMPGFEAFQDGTITTIEYATRLGEYLGGLSADEALRIHNSMLVEPFAGVLEIVHDLNGRGFVTGCLSNTNAPHWEDLAKSGRFPAIVAMQVQLASFAIDASKPDPRAFAAFETAAGSSPSEVILFDDSLLNVQAAEGLGWSAVLIDPHGDPASQTLEALRGRGILS
ncbi:MAG TPA: HAD-IA family hydrolase [Fimbriimonadaceae bacterium]|nr:HAD-IA family hydrolase [Fimbriimonadaceae bacterium]